MLMLPALAIYPEVATAAGFAKQSLFLSRSDVIEGESVLIHTVVSNDARDPFKGTLALRDADQKIGSVPVSLKSGEAIAVSVSWVPQAGKRTVHAELMTDGGIAVESMSETFSIAERPKPPPAGAASSSDQSAASVQSSVNIQEKIGDLSPAVQQASAPVFNVLDAGREKAAHALDGQLNIAKAKLGDVQGAYDDRKEGELPSTVSGFWVALWTLYFYFLTVMRFLIGSAAIFYPLFAILLLLFMWKMFRRFGRR
jgi:hypothetical protein